MKRLVCVLLSLALLFCAAPLGALAEGGITGATWIPPNLPPGKKKDCLSSPLRPALPPPSWRLRPPVKRMWQTPKTSPLPWIPNP